MRGTNRKPSMWQVPNTLICEASGIRVMLPDPKIGVVSEQPIQYVQCGAHCRVDHFRAQFVITPVDFIASEHMRYPTLPDKASGSRLGHLAFTRFIHLPKQLDRFQQRGARRRNPEIECVQEGRAILANLRILVAHLVEKIAIKRFD
jgi:hypothetical protein